MKNQKIINICITSDDNYIEHLYVTLYSLLVNLNKEYNYNIYILDWWLNKESKNLVNNLLVKFVWIKIFYIKVNVEKYSKYPSLFGTYQTYFRLDIPNLIPNDIEKILYLDPDIIVNWDISNIYNTNLDWYSIWAPTEETIHLVYDHILKFHNKNWYFNWWVLLMNLKYFRKNNLSTKLINYIIKAEKNFFCDQDALNYILWDTRKPISWQYNVTEMVCYKHYFSKNKSVIIHYCWWWKPWLNYCTHPMKTLYINYRKQSWLKEIKLIKSKKKYILSKYKQTYYIIRSILPHIMYCIWILRLKLLSQY